MTAPDWVRRPLAMLLVACCLLGCSSLPEDGPVKAVEQAKDTSALEPPYFRPPGPRKGDTMEAIVRGFLAAMEANPVDIRAAQSFLTEGAADSWQPGQRTLIYQATALESGTSAVTVRLTGISRIDAQGRRASAPIGSRDLRLRLVQENGEWRIATPPNALIVGAAFFRSTFAPYKVYFYDNTGTGLVPALVHLPRGEQTASNLVRALLNGPDPVLRAVTSSAFPQRTELDLAVTVTRAGVADVPLSPNVLRLSPKEVSRAMVQLAATLRAVPGITRITASVDGVPVPLADGRTGVDIDEGADLAPYGRTTSRTPVGVRNGHLVRLDDRQVRAVNGPLGRRGYDIRTVAQTRAGDEVAAVSAGGTRVYAAAMTGRTPPKVASTGIDFARPVIDRAGQRWLLDRNGGAARVWIGGAVVRETRIPGVSGVSVRQLAVSPDGVRLASLVDTSRGPRVVLFTVVRDAAGRVKRIARATRLDVGEAAAGAEIGRAVDLGWVDEVTMVVLSAPTRSSSRLTAILVDGAAADSFGQRDDLDVAGVQLLVGAVPDAEVGVLGANGQLHLSDSAGKWLAPLTEKFTGVAYPG